MISDRRRARALYARSRTLAIMAIGFLIATLIYPSRPYMLPSTMLGISSAVSFLVVNTWAFVLWRRDR